MGTSRERITERLDSVISNLPPKKLEQLLEFAEYLKSREDWAATRELMQDPRMARDVEEGRAQAARGKGKAWRDVRNRIRG